MKKLILVAAFALCSFHVSFSQTENADSVMNAVADKLAKVFSTEVIMDIDTKLFSQHEGNIYMTKDNDAMIMTIVAPQSFAKAKEQHDGREEEEEDENYQLTGKGEFEENGKKILFRIGKIKKDEKEGIIEQYMVSATEDSTIIVTGFYELKLKPTYESVIRKAAVSARLK